MSSLVEEDLKIALDEKISLGEELLAKVAHLDQIEGISKLYKKVKQEIIFLKKVISKNPKKEHLMCTNLHHFSALIKYMETNYEESFGSSNQPCKITVDVVTHKRNQWVKVIARNPRALTQLSAGAGKYGQRSIVDQAEQFVSCSKEHPVLYNPPKVVFFFSNGIEQNLARHLEARGVIVEGTRITDSAWQGSYSDEDDDSDEENLIETNSTGFTGSLTDNHNGSINKLNLDQPLLMQQAEWERKRPVKPVLDELFEGKKLYCCISAERDFLKIVHTMAGPSERERATALMARVTVVPDQIPPRVAALALSAKVKSRSQTVFGTGDALKAITVSANEGFVRGAHNQGIEFVVFLHESRALTEAKEQLASEVDTIAGRKSVLSCPVTEIIITLLLGSKCISKPANLPVLLVSCVYHTSLLGTKTRKFFSDFDFRLTNCKALHTCCDNLQAKWRDRILREQGLPEAMVRQSKGSPT
ncbi:Hypothetical predicted protein [Cloeon dipterum]|uniref:DUF1308 domain-containing protein n=1 Tax=Cloeon dipterum TaxID=197152 RepID=A0A8S1BRX4_9INSE|nr:Hypothetical predicted protein [Cloeon dipterum]